MQHNKTHQTLFENWGKEKGKWKYNGGAELIKSTLYTL
jgi:hypothetical protein